MECLLAATVIPDELGRAIEDLVGERTMIGLVERLAELAEILGTTTRSSGPVRSLPWPSASGASSRQPRLGDGSRSTGIASAASSNARARPSR
jgi:hypothetical protein